MNLKNLKIQRVRHPIVVRTLTVKSIEDLAKNYRRIVFHSDDLTGFISSSFDDHIKLFIAEDFEDLIVPSITEHGLVFPEGKAKPAARDYTPYYFDAQTNCLTVDFVLHPSGPAGEWASQAKRGQQMAIAGPRGSMVVPTAYDWHLLIGDETAIPAISRRLVELQTHEKVVVILELENDNLLSLLPEHPHAQVHLHIRTDDKSGLAQTVQSVSLPSGNGFAWAAAESTVVKLVREVLVHFHGLSNDTIRASSYWRIGDVAVHESVE